jgi:hypothetical protein
MEGERKGEWKFQIGIVLRRDVHILKGEMERGEMEGERGKGKGRGKEVSTALIRHTMRSSWCYGLTCVPWHHVCHILLVSPAPHGVTIDRTAAKLHIVLCGQGSGAWEDLT